MEVYKICSKIAWKKHLLLFGLSVMVLAQIFVFLHDKGLIEKYSMRSSEIEHLYSDDLSWELLKKQLKIIEIENKTLFNELLALVMRRSVKETLFIIKSYTTNRDVLFGQRNLINKTDHSISSVGTISKTTTLPEVTTTPERTEKPQLDKGRLPNCSVDFSELRGRENVNHAYHGFSYLEKIFNDTEIGGRWKPENCTASQRIAIIIPYRDRDPHLKLLLFNLIPKLRRQKVDYTLYLVEQGHGSQFNRGMIRNVGFMEARKQGNYDCYIFNDVDTLIENDTNIYKCLQNKAYHMAASVDIFNYKLLYPSLIGGILSFPQNLFLKVNGYSNFFFMWGAEDDDMWRRIRGVGSSVIRPPKITSYVTTLKHERDAKMKERVILFNRISPFAKKDGLNSLNYQVITIEKRKLFTWIYLKVNETYFQEMLKKYMTEREAVLAKQKKKAKAKPKPRNKNRKQQRNRKKKLRHPRRIKT